MVAHTGRWLAGVILLPVALAPTGCNPLLQLPNLFNPDLFELLGSGGKVASLPGDAPGLLVAVENRTDRWVQMVVSYRDQDEEARSFTTLVAPLDKSGQMLVCPIQEITLGDVSNLQLSGARVFLVDEISADTDLASMPFIEVDAFGVLLIDAVNYNCGDGVTFAVQASSQAASGYRVFAYFRRSGT